MNNDPIPNCPACGAGICDCRASTKRDAAPKVVDKMWWTGDGVDRDLHIIFKDGTTTVLYNAYVTDVKEEGQDPNVVSTIFTLKPRDLIK